MVHANEVIRSLCEHHFNQILLSFEIKTRKPNPRSYEILAEKLGYTDRVDYKRILFIDDKIGNVH